MRNLYRRLLAAPALALTAAAVSAQDSVLEHYVLGSGGTIAPQSGRINAFIQDADFGGGDAEASVFLDTIDSGSQLHVRVWRNVPAGNISFALLVFGIEVRGFDAAGAQVYTRELGEFTFGDSRSGNWARGVKLPRRVARVEVRFIGNYE